MANGLGLQQTCHEPLRRLHIVSAFCKTSAEIANKEELPILGMVIVIFKHYHTDGTHTNIRLDNILYMPKASGRFYSTGVATQKGCEARETQLTNKIYSSDGTLLIEGTDRKSVV